MQNLIPFYVEVPVIMKYAIINQGTPRYGLHVIQGAIIDVDHTPLLPTSDLSLVSL